MSATEKEAAKRAADDLIAKARERAHAQIEAGMITGRVEVHFNAGRPQSVSLHLTEAVETVR